MTTVGAPPRGGTVDARSWLPLAVFALAVAAYANAASGEFVYDDLTLIVNNEVIADPTRWRELVTFDLWGLLGRASNYYRPLPSLLFLALRAAGGGRPEPFHLLSIALHAGASTLVFLLAARLTGRQGAPSPSLAAFGAAALFAVHPVHTEAVAWASGLMDVACGAFALGAIYAWVRADDGPRGPFLALSLASLSLALLSKEAAVAVPLVLAAYDLLYRRDLVPSPAAAARRWAPPALVAAAYLLLRAAVLGGLAPERLDGGASFAGVVLALPQLLGHYVRLCVAPLGLTVTHDVPALLASPLSVLAAVGGLGLLAFLCWHAWRARGAAAIGLALFLLTIAPALAVPWLAHDLSSKTFAERFLYLPSAGLALAAAGALARLRDRRSARAVAAVVAILVVVLGGMTLARNRIWKDALAFWSDAATKSPNVAAARENYGLALLGRGRADEGVRELRAALAIEPDLPERWLGAGTASARKGRTMQAILSFQTALLYRPTYADAHYNLAVAFEHMGWNRDAIAEYKATIASAPGHAAAHNNLGIIYAQTYRHDEALEQFRAAVGSRPDDPELRSNLARAYEAKGMTREAEAERARARALTRPRQ